MNLLPCHIIFVCRKKLCDVAWCSTRGTQRGVEEEVSLGSGAKNVAGL